MFWFVHSGRESIKGLNKAWYPTRIRKANLKQEWKIRLTAELACTFMILVCVCVCVWGSMCVKSQNYYTMARKEYFKNHVRLHHYSLRWYELKCNYIKKKKNYIKASPEFHWCYNGLILLHQPRKLPREVAKLNCQCRLRSSVVKINSSWLACFLTFL